MYLLDTNHCSRITDGDVSVIQQLQAHTGMGVATSAIVRGELIYMAEKSRLRAENLQKIQEFLAIIDIYLIDQETADLYGQLKAAIFAQFAPKDRTKQRGVKINDLGFGDNDIWIAATALQYNLTVVSADSDFVRMRSVREFPLENWCN
jgi:tRNA(fMet)-specific endonuclease VapC